MIILKKWYLNIKKIMNKKIYTIVFLVLLISSCGKKGDPYYKKSTQYYDSAKPKIVLWDIKIKILQLMVSKLTR